MQARLSRCLSRSLEGSWLEICSDSWLDSSDSWLELRVQRELLDFRLFCGVLTKNMAAFCPCPKNLLRAKFKSYGLNSWVGQISRQPNINSIMWLLIITLIHVYSEKEHVGQKEILMYSLKRTRARLMLKEFYQIYFWGKERMPSGHNPSQLDFQLVEGTNSKRFLLLENINKGTLLQM